MNSTVDTFAAIRAAVEGSRERVVQSLREAIEIESESPPGNAYDLIIDHFARQLGELGLDPERIEMPSEVFAERVQRYHPTLTCPRINLVARTAGVAAVPRIAFSTHLDTVPAGDPSSWTVPPFAGWERDGRIWGRGAADSKGNAVAIVWALRVVAELGLRYGCDPVIALTTDEEIGGYSGLMHLVDRGAFDGCRFFYSADGSTDCVGIATIGGFKWRVRIAGTSAHSALAFLGNNPIERSAILLEELLALKRDVMSRKSSLPLSAPIRELTSQDSLTSSLSVTIAHGGTAQNVIPDEFVLAGDRRFIPEEDEATCIDELEQAVERARRRDPELHCELSIQPFYPGFANRSRDPWVDAVCRGASMVRAENVPPAAIFGSSDAAYVAKQLGIPVAFYGVGRLSESNEHGADENCRIDDLLSHIRLIAALIVDPFITASPNPTMHSGPA